MTSFITTCRAEVNRLDTDICSCCENGKAETERERECIQNITFKDKQFDCTLTSDKQYINTCVVAFLAPPKPLIFKANFCWCALIKNAEPRPRVRHRCSFALISQVWVLLLSQANQLPSCWITAVYDKCLLE